MKGLKTTIMIILVLVFSTAAYSQGLAIAAEKPSSAQEKAAIAKDDVRLPTDKQGWNFIVAPYLWIPGAHITLVRQGRFSGTTAVDIPWYNVVPLLFSQALGGMCRVEIRKGRWGFFSDTVFIYLSDSLSGGGSKEITVNPGQQLSAAVPARIGLTGHLKVWTRLLWQDVGVRFLMGNVPLKAGQPLPVLSCELFGGLRYSYYNQDTRPEINATLTAQGTEPLSRGGSFTDSLIVSVVEPLLGLRLGFWFTPKLNLLLRGDCGGFGFVAYSSVDSVLEAMVGYQVHEHIRLYGGYRALYFTRTGNGRPLAAHGWFHGPTLGAAFNF
jgi:hypothetical protein